MGKKVNVQKLELDKSCTREKYNLNFPTRISLRKIKGLALSPNGKFLRNDNIFK